MSLDVVMWVAPFGLVLLLGVCMWLTDRKR